MCIHVHVQGIQVQCIRAPFLFKAHVLTITHVHVYPQARQAVHVHVCVSELAAPTPPMVYTQDYILVVACLSYPYSQDVYLSNQTKSHNFNLHDKTSLGTQQTLCNMYYTYKDGSMGSL